MEGNSNFKITISFHSSIFGMEGNKMEWKEIATPQFFNESESELYLDSKTRPNQLFHPKAKTGFVMNDSKNIKIKE